MTSAPGAHARASVSLSELCIYPLLINSNTLGNPGRESKQSAPFLLPLSQFCEINMKDWRTWGSARQRCNLQKRIAGVIGPYTSVSLSKQHARCETACAVRVCAEADKHTRHSVHVNFGRGSKRHPHQSGTRGNVCKRTGFRFCLWLIHCLSFIQSPIWFYSNLSTHSLALSALQIV